MKWWKSIIGLLKHNNRRFVCLTVQLGHTHTHKNTLSNKELVSGLCSEFSHVNRLVIQVFSWAHLWAPTTAGAITQISLRSSFLCETNRRAWYLPNYKWEKEVFFADSHILTMPPTQGGPRRRKSGCCWLFVCCGCLVLHVKCLHHFFN